MPALCLAGLGEVNLDPSRLDEALAYHRDSLEHAERERQGALIGRV